MLSGPMFEPAKSEHWESQKRGAHYNIFAACGRDEMTALRELFKDGEADELNFCLFSTSGVHGMYTTIEEVEASVIHGKKDEDGYGPDDVTFLVCHPRIVCMRYGNCKPKTLEDFAFLKKLRETSWKVVQQIGAPSEGVSGK